MRFVDYQRISKNKYVDVEKRHDFSGSKIVSHEEIGCLKSDVHASMLR